MSIEQIIKAWKDEDFRNSLSPEQLENLPESPVGLIALEELEFINGAATSSRCPPGGQTQGWDCRSCNCTRPPEAGGSCS